jgi:hypothetical protein
MEKDTLWGEMKARWRDRLRERRWEWCWASKRDEDWVKCLVGRSEWDDTKLMEKQKESGLALLLGLF